MNREGHEDIKFFIGKEVERSPAYGMDTLFVVGIQSYDDIIDLCNQHDIDHIYLGANQSFVCGSNKIRKAWQELLLNLLDIDPERFWVTLDFDISQYDQVRDMQVFQHNKFIPMISCKLPGIISMGYNAVIKIDDSDFRNTNPGVWCHSLTSLLTRETFTHWDRYTNDMVISDDITTDTDTETTEELNGT